MSFPVFAWGVRFFSLLMLVVYIGLIFLLNPEGKSWAVPLFFALWFVTVFGVVATFLISIYRRVTGEAKTLSFRFRIIEQSVLMSGLVTMLLVLHYNRALVWWTAGLVVALVLLIELSLRTRHRQFSNID